MIERSRRICLYGSASYSQPLSPDQSRKFEALSCIAKIVVVGTSRSNRFESFGAASARFVLLPLPRNHFLRFPVRMLASAFVLSWFAVAGKAEVIAVQSPYDAVPAIVSRRVTRLLRRRRIAVVVESHGDYDVSPFMESATQPPPVVRRWLVWLARFGARRADALRCVSVATYETLRGAAPEVPALIYPAWIDLSPFQEVERVRSDVFLYAGAIIPRKGVVDLVLAFNQIAAVRPAAQLVLAGPENDEPYAAQVRERIRARGLHNRVTMIGPVSHQDLSRLFAQARAVVLPSYAEGFPRVLVEAMSAGAPVIATRVSGVPELVRHGVDGILVEPRDVAGLADAMRRFLDNPDEADQMGQRGRQRVPTIYSREGYVDHYADVVDLASRQSGAT